MLHRQLFGAMFAVALGLTGSGQASAQCIECGMQMQQAWHSNVASRSIYDSMRRDQQRRRASPPAGQVQAVTEQQLQDAALAPLWPEYQRRMQADGKDSADRWALATGKTLGHQVASLMPQYKQRVRSQGQAAANRWYLDAARQTSNRYIQASR